MTSQNGTRSRPAVWRFLLLPLLTVSLAGSSTGQEPSANGADAVEQAKREVLALENEQVQDVFKGDAEALDRVYADDIAYTYANGELVSKSQALANIRSGKNKLFVPNHDDIRVQVYGDTVVLTGRTQSTLRCCDEKATSLKVHSRFTKVYVKLDGRWQMVVHQTTPITNP
jgi:uncharacterized protein (TIGR02246 family)